MFLLDTNVVSELRKVSSQSANPMPDYDTLIAATALVHSLTVVTRNTEDFERTGVKLLNPWQQISLDD